VKNKLSYLFFLSVFIILATRINFLNENYSVLSRHYWAWIICLIVAFFFGYFLSIKASKHKFKYPYLYLLFSSIIFILPYRKIADTHVLLAYLGFSLISLKLEIDLFAYPNLQRLLNISLLILLVLYSYFKGINTLMELFYLCILLIIFYLLDFKQ